MIGETAYNQRCAVPQDSRMLMNATPPRQTTPSVLDLLTTLESKLVDVSIKADRLATSIDGPVPEAGPSVLEASSVVERLLSLVNIALSVEEKLGRAIRAMEG